MTLRDKPDDAYRIQVVHIGTGEWVTMKTRYRKKETAKSWVRFVKTAWHSPKGRVRSERQIVKDQENEPCDSTSSSC